MKSIKEKAEEYLRENNITQYEYKSYIEGADFGTSYVLDEVKILLNSQRFVDNPSQELFELIKQLKK